MGIKPSVALLWVRRAIVGLVSFLFATIAALWITAYSDEHKWFAHPSAQLAYAMSAAASILASPWLHWIGGIVVGFAGGVWLDAFLRKKAATENNAVSAEKPNLPDKAALPAHTTAERPAPYRQHVLQMDNPVSSHEKNSNGDLTKTQTVINIRNVSSSDLKNCTIAVVAISDGQETHVLDTFMGGTRKQDGGLSPIFALPRGGQRSITVIRRDLADLISRPPYLLSLGSGRYPLADNTTYTLQIEMRSEAPAPTKVTMQMEVGEREILKAKILDQSV